MQSFMLLMPRKVSSVVDAATGGALDFTVDSPSVNGEKMEVFVFVCFSMLLLTSILLLFYICVDLFANADEIGEVALWNGGEPVEDHGELLHH